MRWLTIYRGTDAGGRARWPASLLPWRAFLLLLLVPGPPAHPAQQYCAAPTLPEVVVEERPRRDDCLVAPVDVHLEESFLVDVSALPDSDRSWVPGARKLRPSELVAKPWVPRDETLLVLGTGFSRASDERLCARLRSLGLSRARVLRGGVVRAIREAGWQAADTDPQRIVTVRPRDVYEAVEAGEYEVVQTARLLAENGVLRTDALLGLAARAHVERPVLLVGPESDYAQVRALGRPGANLYLLEGGADAYHLYALDRTYASASRGGSLQRCAAPF